MTQFVPKEKALFLLTCTVFDPLQEQVKGGAALLGYAGELVLGQVAQLSPADPTEELKIQGKLKLAGTPLCPLNDLTF